MINSNVFESLISKSREVMRNLSDNRKQSNAMKYDMESAGMGGLSVFLMQDPSFLSHQERLAKGTSINNFSTLFGCKNIPTPNQIRNMMDGVDPTELEMLYNNALEVLRDNKGLDQFKYLTDGYLIALDGTEYHSSENIHCCNCTSKSHAGKTRYHHSMLASSIVSPDIKEAVALIPEFIVPQDGHDKQDCENAAMKRWLSKHGKDYMNLNPTILGDDLFSRQSICAAVLEENFHFIFTCKPDSHKTLYEYITGVNLDVTSIILKKKYKTYTYQYRFVNQVPIREGKDALLVNFFEIVEIDQKTNKVLYKSSFITDHHITKENVHKLASSGRAKWRIENENNNTLKTKGYRFEHNYGHGKNNLSMVFASLAVVAFLYHTVMGIIDSLYIATKKFYSTRVNFFNMIKAVTAVMLFKSWNNLMAFLLKPPDPATLKPI